MFMETTRPKLLIPELLWRHDATFCKHLQLSKVMWRRAASRLVARPRSCRVDPYLIHGSLDPHESTPIDSSICSAVLRSWPVWPTHRQTTHYMRRRSVAMDRICALHACDAA